MKMILFKICIFTIVNINTTEKPSLWNKFKLAIKNIGNDKKDSAISDSTNLDYSDNNKNDSAILKKTPSNSPKNNNNFTSSPRSRKIPDHAVLFYQTTPVDTPKDSVNIERALFTPESVEDKETTPDKSSTESNKNNVENNQTTSNCADNSDFTKADNDTQPKSENDNLGIALNSTDKGEELNSSIISVSSKDIKELENSDTNNNISERSEDDILEISTLSTITDKSEESNTSLINEASLVSKKVLPISWCFYSSNLYNSSHFIKYNTS
jgi:hypothetical protein